MSDEERTQDFLNRLHNIMPEHLKLIENDLSLHQKISLFFLLFGDDPLIRDIVLQDLLVLQKNKGGNCDLLRHLSTMNHWGLKLLEGLSIIRAINIIKKLGINPSDMEYIYLPRIPESSVHINPILKLLYNVCDRLTPAEAGALMLTVSENETLSRSTRYICAEYMEIFFLYLICNNFINTGIYVNSTPQSNANLDLLIEYFKLKEEFIDVKELLLTCLGKFHLSATRHLVELDYNQAVSQSTSAEQVSANKHEQNHPRKFGDINDERYEIRRERAGFLLIINQRNFTRNTNPLFEQKLPEEVLSDRLGTDRDKDILKITFEERGYNAKIMENLDHKLMIYYIREVVKRSIYYDSLIVCILSHGTKGSVYGSDSIPVEISQIESELASEILSGKPKILIIQACQGIQKHVIVPVNTDKLQFDGIGSVTVLPHCDILVAISTMDGFVSVRDPINGTWYIQTLCDCIQKMGDDKDIYNILIKVNDKVTSLRGPKGECMVPELRVRLRRQLYLCPKK